MPRVRIYTMAACPYCVSAKRLMSSLGAEVEEIRLDEQPDLWDRLERELDWKSVPMVFVGDEFLGGWDDTARLHREGRLLPKLFPDRA
jgi:glutaredoxin 3